MRSRLNQAQCSHSRASSPRVILGGLTLLSLLLGSPTTTTAEVFLAQDEAIHAAFGEGAETSSKTIMLSSEQRSSIEELSQSKLPSSLFHYYEGFKNGQSLGYAVIDSRVMRTNLAIFMVVFSKELVVQKVILLAFHEPSEYQPTNGWLKLLEGDKPMQDLVPGQGLPPIAGSTLTINGLSDGVRAVRATCEVVLKGTK